MPYTEYTRFILSSILNFSHKYTTDNYHFQTLYSMYDIDHLREILFFRGEREEEMKLAAVPQAGEKCEKKEMWPTNLKIEIVRSRVWNAMFGGGGV